MSRSRYNDAYRRALDAISLQRRHPSISLNEAAFRAGTTLESVKRHAGSALRYRHGRWEAAPHDTLPRPMLFLTPRGYVTVTTRDSDDARMIAQYYNAVREYLATGSTRKLKRFEGWYIEAPEGEFDFVTDSATINRLARAGAVSFLDIYGPEGSR
jgi:hypothetical protein